VLTITQAQMRSLQEHQIKGVAGEIVLQLRLAHPELCEDLNADKMFRSVVTSIHSAISFGLNDQHDFRIFAFLHLFVARSFESGKVARRILTDGRIVITDRVGTYLRTLKSSHQRHPRRSGR
jgi:hypothetical protein